MAQIFGIKFDTVLSCFTGSLVQASLFYIMGYTRVLLVAIIVAMITEKAWGFISYDVQSTIVGLMDQRDFTALQKVRLTRDNVRPIFRKDISGKVRNKRALVMLFFWN